MQQEDAGSLGRKLTKKMVQFQISIFNQSRDNNHSFIVVGRPGTLPAACSVVHQFSEYFTGGGGLILTRIFGCSRVRHTIRVRSQYKCITRIRFTACYHGKFNIDRRRSLC